MNAEEILPADVAAATIYDRLWEETCSRLAGPGVEIDPHLDHRAADHRRGFTLIARPHPGVQVEVARFMEELDKVAPRQHTYRTSELHVTILSVFVCVADWAPNARRLPGVEGRLAGVMQRQSAFELVFRGVTASPEAVVIQGFPVDESLRALRQRADEEFAAIGLTGEINRRYPPVTAHLTVMRFRRQLADCKAFKRCVEANRHREFGRSRVTRLQLVRNDWYMSDETVWIVAEYPLA